MTYIRTGGFLRHCHHRSWLGWFGHGRLAHSGLTVLICEQAPQVGGYFRAKLPGWRGSFPSEAETWVKPFLDRSPKILGNLHCYWHAMHTDLQQSATDDKPAPSK